MYQHEVGLVTLAYEAALLDAEEQGGVVAHLLHRHRQQFFVVDGGFEHHLQRVLDAGDAAGGVEVGLLLGFERVGGMVGGDGIDDVVLEGCPEGQAVLVALDGRVALDEVAQFGIVAVVEPQVVGRHLGGDMLFLEVKIAEQAEFGGRTDMGHMEAGAVLAGTFDGFVGAEEAGLVVAYFGMQGCGFAGGTLIFALGIGQVGLHHSLLLAVGHDEFAGVAEEVVELLGVVDQHVACAGAKE